MGYVLSGYYIKDVGRFLVYDPETQRIHLEQKQSLYPTLGHGGDASFRAVTACASGLGSNLGLNSGHSIHAFSNNGAVERCKTLTLFTVSHHHLTNRNQCTIK